MKVAVISKDKTDTVKLIPTDVDYALIVAPGNKLYADEQLRQPGAAR